MANNNVFRCWGTLNDFNSEKYEQFQTARELHNVYKLMFPNEHKELLPKNNWKCWHECKCSCGFEYSWDSSD